ncbi:MAG: RagB/SusD family nutrient uptake outer membrane protein [Bacteroidaceae bacterium]|nr:RagB/SusD family nutrient uptake outer membrane protein [Bacteroidaceae bacterium]
MKTKSIITLLCLCMGLSIATTSCEDIMSADSDRYSYSVAGDTLYSYWGILKGLQNLGERYVILGECRGDLVDGIPDNGDSFISDSINAILTFGLNGDTEGIRDGACRYLKVSDYYQVINSCNAYLASVDTDKKTSGGVKYMTREAAQVQAIRAWVYMQLVVNYGDVPFYTKPMLSTGDVENFDTKDAENRVNAGNLYQKLEEDLINAYNVEITPAPYGGFPQYNKYGYTTLVCESTKAMFPCALVLADIYLMGNQYEKAAQYYYNYLYGQYGGVLPTGYYSTAYRDQGEELHGSVVGMPWSETGRTKKSEEAVTAIPSSTNGMWGTVQRGVNDVFGFKATITQSTGKNDSITRASIWLTQDWEQQLSPSAGYEELRKSQKYEAYICPNLDDIDDMTKTSLQVLEDVGDARGVPGERGNGYICRYNSGDYIVGTTQYKTYVMKQNPYGAFSTVYPIVYRKSQIWLRFAEALNRAGFPGYAFAILKNGLTKNKEWLPSKEDDFLPNKYYVYYTYKNDEGETVTVPENYEELPECQVTNPDIDEDAYENDIELLNTYLEDNSLIPEGKTIEDLTMITGGIVEDAGYANYMSDESGIICNYISLNEYRRSIGQQWLNFQDESHFAGATSLPINYFTNWPLTPRDALATSSYPKTGLSDGEYMARGIHQKGCGLLKYNERNSVYNFVDQINLKREAAGKSTLTKQEMYDPANLAEVQEAIEELIVDEEALELAFEGSRFFDILRAALHRGNGTPDMTFIRSKIAKRDETASTWANSLTEKNIYLPLPDNSNR